MSIPTTLPLATTSPPHSSLPCSERLTALSIVSRQRRRVEACIGIYERARGRGMIPLLPEISTRRRTFILRGNDRYGVPTTATVVALVG